MQRQKRKLTFKKYLARRTTKRVFRKAIGNSEEIYTKCEYYDEMYVAAGSGTQYVFNSTPGSYLNVRAMLAASTSFTDNATLYSRYKIVGISVRLTRLIPDQIIATSTQDLPSMYMAFYPQLVTTNAGTGPAYNDSKASFEGLAMSPQSKYWKFKDNFFEASSGGYGTWNNISDYSTISGQLSTYNPSLLYAIAGNSTHEIRVTLYIKFSTRNR